MNSVHDAVTRQWGELVELVVIQDAVTHQVDRRMVSLSFNKTIHLYTIHRVNGECGDLDHMLLRRCPSRRHHKTIILMVVILASTRSQKGSKANLNTVPVGSNNPLSRGYDNPLSDIQSLIETPVHYPLTGSVGLYKFYYPMILQEDDFLVL